MFFGSSVSLLFGRQRGLYELYTAQLFRPRGLYVGGEGWGTEMLGELGARAGAFFRVSWREGCTSVVADHGNNSPKRLSEVAHSVAAVRCPNILRQGFLELLELPVRVSEAERPGVFD